MKKIFAITTACILALAIGGTALAQCRKGDDCDNCIQGGRLNQANTGSVAAGEPDPYRQFKQNTLDLRQEMMNKRFELQRENLKATSDAAKVAGLKADIRTIQAKINVIRLQSGIPDNGKRDGECFKMDGGCKKQNGMGDCNGQPCGQK
jgi:hypothetical protein